MKLFDLILCNRQGETFQNIACIEGNCMKCGTATLSRKIQPLLTNEEIEWTKLNYISVPNHKTGNETKKRQIVSRTTSSHQTIAERFWELQFLVHHLFIAQWQQAQFRHLTNHTQEKYVVLTIDFVENLTCCSQNETHWAH